MKKRPKEALKTETQPSAGAVKRRTEIVNKAADLFNEVGYYPTSMDEIAYAVGLAKPTLYHYFRSKDSILLAIHDEIISLLTERQKIRDNEADVDPRQQIYDVMLDNIDLMRTHPHHVRAYFEHRRELPESAQAEAQGLRNDYFLSVRKLFVKGQEAGYFKGDPQLSTITLFSLCNQVYQWYGPNEPYTTREATDYFHALLMKGIAAD